MLVPHGSVAMPMRVWLGHLILMGMIMVCIMHMPVGVLQFIMDMFMLVALGQMQPEANRHQATCEYELHRHGFSQQ